MRVLFVTSEVYPLAKSGGLADVSRALPIALERSGVDVRILMPGYSSALANLEAPCIKARLPAELGVQNSFLIGGKLPGSGIPVFLIYAPTLYERPGGLYQDPSHRDWEDNPRRFSYLARVAAYLATGNVAQWKADLVHANDWHAALVPLFLRMTGNTRPATILTIHNLAFQGNFSPTALEQANIPERFFTVDGMEFHGNVSFLKAGVRFSDKITTVSPRYCNEVMTPEHSCGFEGLLKSRERDFTGILNGIDDQDWNPATDKSLAQRYNLHDLSGKRVCKSDLQEKLGLSIAPATPVLGFVSRITQQKMADILVECVPGIMALGAQLVIVGDGDASLLEDLAQLQARYSGQLALRSYDEILAHRLQAGCDILLAPARYEPCGLTQMYAQRYGTIPIVRATGGLADTVKDTLSTVTQSAATGFLFDEISVSGLMAAITRAHLLFSEKFTWRRLQINAMSQDFSWRKSAASYAALYRELSGLPIQLPTKPGPQGAEMCYA